MLALCQVWLKLVQLFWRFCQCILLFRNYLSLKKGRGPSFDKTLIRFTQGCFVPSLVEIGPVVWKDRFLALALYLNKLEFPISEDALCYVWLKLALWFW